MNLQRTICFNSWGEAQSIIVWELLTFRFPNSLINCQVRIIINYDFDIFPTCLILFLLHIQEIIAKTHAKEFFPFLSSSTVSCFMFKSLIHFEYFCEWYTIRCPGVCGYSVFPAPFIEEIILFPLYVLSSSVENQLIVYARLYFWALTGSVFMPEPQFWLPQLCNIVWNWEAWCLQFFPSFSRCFLYSCSSVVP